MLTPQKFTELCEKVLGSSRPLEPDEAEVPSAPSLPAWLTVFALSLFPSLNAKSIVVYPPTYSVSKQLCGPR